MNNFILKLASMELNDFARTQGLVFYFSFSFLENGNDKFLHSQYLYYAIDITPC